MIKKVVYSYYVHKSNLSELLSSLTPIEQKQLKEVISTNNDIFASCSIVKFNRRTQRVSLICTVGWVELQEPLVKESYCFLSPISYKLIKGGTKVYHHKWQFVGEGYSDFDIEKSKQRSKQWEKIVEKYKINKSKIGNKDFWYSFLEEFNMGR